MAEKITREQFVQRANILHGHKYDYSFVPNPLPKNDTKIPIICSKHKIIFYQFINVHLASRGCKKCGLENRKPTKPPMGTKEFVQRAKEKFHIEDYIYDKVNYADIFTKVTIICKIHGSFEIVPHDFLRSKGCLSCFLENRKTTLIDFINRSNEVHGNKKYDYSKVKYSNNHIKVEIICSTHGSFFQRPLAHLKGQGCRQCSYDDRRDTKEIFINKAKSIHGDVYTYSDIVYYNSKSKVAVTCKVHGNFNILASSHLNGSGCSKCFNEGRRLSTDDFVRRAIDIHKERYDYTKTEYTIAKNKVVVVCPSHGEFKISPGNHLCGSGCPRCDESKGETTIRQWLTERGVNFTQEYRFDNCRNILPLPFDFALHSSNGSINMLIEYHGIQHYECCNWFGGQKEFEYRIKNDLIKRDYCISKCIPLVIIPYYEKNISKILTEAIG